MYANQIYKTMALTEIAIQHIKASKRLRSLLALASNKTEYTIVRWADRNDDNLTKACNLEVIRKETGLNDEEILSKESAQA